MVWLEQKEPRCAMRPTEEIIKKKLSPASVLGAVPLNIISFSAIRTDNPPTSCCAVACSFLFLQGYSQFSKTRQSRRRMPSVSVGESQLQAPLPTTGCSSSSISSRRRQKQQKKLLLQVAVSSSSIPTHHPQQQQQQHEDDAALLALLRSHATDAAFRLFCSNPDILPSSPTTASRLLAQLSFNSRNSGSKSDSFSRVACVLQRLRARNALSLLDANALSLAAAAAARSGNASLAHSLILYMLRQGLFPDRRAYTAAVSRLQPPSKAVRLFQAVLRHLRRNHIIIPRNHSSSLCLPDTAAFNAALNACADAGDCERFRNLFDEMQQQCWGEQSPSPDAVTFNVVIKMCARVGRKDLVARVLERMLSAGINPCAATFHSLVAAYVGFGDISTAEKIVQAMREGRKDISSLLLSSIDVDVASEAEHNKQRRAGAVLEDIVLVPEENKEEEVPPPLRLLPNNLKAVYPPDARVYTTLMKGYMHAGRVDDVLAMLRAMQHEALPSSKPDHVTFTTVISALVAAGDMERARAILDKDMAAAGVPATRVTYNILIKGYCQHLQITKAKDLFYSTMQMEKRISPDVVTYNTLMDGCVLTDDSAGALALFNEMRSRGIAPSTVSYTTLMKAFAASGQPKVAHKVFQEMQRDPSRVTVDRAAWNMLIEAYCRLGLLETARQIVDKMKKDGGLEPDAATYGSLAKCIALARKPGEALLLWNEVKERCPDPDEELLEALADICVRAAFFKKALEIVACMEERGIAPNKAKYKKMYIEMHSRMFTSKHASQARQNRRRERKRAAEAFKFWLGLPNEYYGTNTTNEWRIEPLPLLDGDDYLSH